MDRIQNTDRIQTEYRQTDKPNHKAGLLPAKNMLQVDTVFFRLFAKTVSTIIVPVHDWMGMLFDVVRGQGWSHTKYHQILKVWFVFVFVDIPPKLSILYRHNGTIVEDS